jgi:TfoX/Sxy family transcriptional regulator of competence genes
MAFSELLASRIRERLSDLPVIEEKEMMGGLAFMVNEKMCVGVIKDEMMCRIDPVLHAEVIEKQGCRTMDFTKQQMKGWVMVEESAVRTICDLDFWIDLSLDFNERAKSSKKK